MLPLAQQWLLHGRSTGSLFPPLRSIKALLAVHEGFLVLCLHLQRLLTLSWIPALLATCILGFQILHVYIKYLNKRHINEATPDICNRQHQKGKPRRTVYQAADFAWH